MPCNRREFLTGSSSLLLLGAAFGFSAAPALAAPAAPADTAQPAASQMNGLERWLLETGRSSVDEDIYRLVAAGA